MTEYRFITVWHIEAPLQHVYDAICDSLQWPDWWHGVHVVEERETGAADGIDSVRRYCWKGRLPYYLCFDARTTRIAPRIALEATVSGDLEGWGRWAFSHEKGVTTVRYDWHVHTTKHWMNWIAPAARTVFSENHHRLMQQGAEGLAHRLNARLIGVSCEDPERAANPWHPVDWRAAAVSGIAAGVVATLAQLALWWLASYPALDMLFRDTRLAAAILLGTQVLPPPATFDARTLSAASLIHVMLSALYGCCMAPLAARLNNLLALGAGALGGLLLFGVNMYGFTALFPWFQASRDWITASAHIVFGMSVAGFYKSRRHWPTILLK